MRTYFILFNILVYALILNGCGEEENIQNQVDKKSEIKKIEINRQAVTFPELPTVTPDSTVDIETH